jgi:hypothetical protein
VVSGCLYAGNIRLIGKVQIVGAVTEDSSGSLMLGGVVILCHRDPRFLVVHSTRISQ